MAAEEASAVSRTPPKTPYQLDHVQTLRACKVLLRHIADEKKRLAAQRSKPNLLADAASGEADDDDPDIDDVPLWLILSTKRHIVDQKKLKPGKILLPHPINTSPNSTICLITADPQQTYTALVAHSSFPATVRSQITRTISLSRLKKNYKSFESRRKLFAEHDLFLADDRIVTYLPGVLGKTFYKGGNKRPVPVNISETPERGSDGKRVKLDPASGKKAKDKIDGGRGAANPEAAAKEIGKALESALVHLSPGVSTAVKVARADFAPENVCENVEAVVNGLTEKFVTKGWRNVRAIHIKGPNTMAFPVWLADELWVDEEDVLEEKKRYGKKATNAINGSEESAKDKGSVDGTKEDKRHKRKANEIGKPTASRHAKKKRKSELEETLTTDLGQAESKKSRKQKVETV